MKRLRVVILLAVTIALLAGALFWSRRTARSRAATPTECLDHYYESCRSGDIEQYRNCLGEPYRSQSDAGGFDAARRDVKDIKNWVQCAETVADGSSLAIDVDEVRVEGVRRLRFHLRQADSGWAIVAIDPPRTRPTPLRYGTRVGDEP